MIKQTKQCNSLLFDGKIQLYGNFLTERYIIIDSQWYVLFWTPHAQLRAESRTDSSPLILSVFLKDLLNDAVHTSLGSMTVLEGYVTIRDFKTGIFAVLNINNTDKRIRVITCGNVHEMFPHINDFVVQRNTDGELLKYVWK